MCGSEHGKDSQWLTHAFRPLQNTCQALARLVVHGTRRARREAMRWSQAGSLAAIVGLGCAVGLSSAREAARRRTKSAPPDPARPQLALQSIAPSSLCITSGELAGARVEVPTFRAVAPGHGGDAASLSFVVRGQSETTRPLASGYERRQLGLKLRANDGCNLVYVMWRLDPKPKLEVSIKRNAGARSNRECGARGYTRIKPTQRGALPMLEYGTRYELRAEIDGDSLIAWVDDRVMWRGKLPAEARELAGPAGLRSDNLMFELAAVAVDARSGGSVDVKCHGRDEAE